MNFVLFLADELRADALACYGNSVIKTPNFDRLAREGVCFEGCYAQNPVCAPSRCCLFTGRYVHVDGHRSLWHLLRPHEKNLLERLRRAGYEVRIYGKNDLLSQEAIPLCTDVFEDRVGLESKRPENTAQRGEPGFYDFLCKPLDCAPGEHKDAQNVQAALDFIRSRSREERPFFVFLPTEMPHCPYTVMEPYYSMYGPQPVRPFQDAEGKAEHLSLALRMRKMENDPDLGRIRAVYYGMTSYTDWLLGQVLETLDECGLAEDTMVIAASDHGDYAGDYGLPEKWPNGMEDELIHVPLLVRGPDCRAGHRVEELVELFDVMPTVLEAADVRADWAYQARPLQEMLSGGRGDPGRLVFCEGGYGEEEAQCREELSEEEERQMEADGEPYYPKFRMEKRFPETVCRTVMVRSKRSKLVLRTRGASEFYDLTEDPSEKENRFGGEKYRAEIENLEKALLRWYLETSDCTPLDRDCRKVKQDGPEEAESG